MLDVKLVSGRDVFEFVLGMTLLAVAVTIWAALGAQYLADIVLIDATIGALTWSIIIPLIVAPPVSFLLAQSLRAMTRLNLELERLANHDPLTGAHNRSAFLAALTSRIAAKQGGGVLAYVDIDRFKVINDTHGHDAGDAVLREVAARLAAVMGDTGLVGRMGGEEFVVFSDDTKTWTPEMLGARVVAAIRAEPVRFEGIAIPITASCGHTAVTDKDDIARALRQADMAMYLAKTAGRDRAISAGEVGSMATPRAPKAPVGAGPLPPGRLHRIRAAG